MAVNTWAVSLMRYGAGTLKCNTGELKILDRRARKFMKMHGALHGAKVILTGYISAEKWEEGVC